MHTAVLTFDARNSVLSGTIDPKDRPFHLTEVQVLLRPDVLANIDLDATVLRDFRAAVRAGNTPAAFVVF